MRGRKVRRPSTASGEGKKLTLDAKLTEAEKEFRTPGSETIALGQIKGMAANWASQLNGMAAGERLEFLRGVMRNNIVLGQFNEGCGNRGRYDLMISEEELAQWVLGEYNRGIK